MQSPAGVCEGKGRGNRGLVFVLSFPCLLVPFFLLGFFPCGLLLVHDGVCVRVCVVDKKGRVRGEWVLLAYMGRKVF